MNNRKNRKVVASNEIKNAGNAAVPAIILASVSATLSSSAVAASDKSLVDQVLLDPLNQQGTGNLLAPVPARQSIQQVSTLFLLPANYGATGTHAAPGADGVNPGDDGSAPVEDGGTGGTALVTNSGMTIDSDLMGGAAGLAHFRLW